MGIWGQEQMGEGTRSLPLNEAKDGALVSGRVKEGHVWIGPQTAKGPGQVDKGKVGPKVLWPQGWELGYTKGPPGRCRTLRIGPQIR